MYCRSLVPWLQQNCRVHHFVELMVNKVLHTYFLFLQKSSLPCDSKYILFDWRHAHTVAKHIVWVNRRQWARHKTCLVYRIFVELPMYVRPYRAFSGLPFNTIWRSSNVIPNFVTTSKINNCNISWCNCKQKIVSVAKLYYNTTGSVLYVCRNAEARSCNHWCSGKAIILHILSVCLYFVLKYAMGKCHTVMCSLPHGCIFFPHYFINDTIFRKKNYWTQNVCFDFRYNFFSEAFLIIRRSERHVIKNVYSSSCKVPVILVRF